MQIWFMFTLISVCAVAVAEISQKISLTQKVDISSITNNFYVWTSMGLIGIILSLVTGNFELITNPYDLLKLVVLGIVYFLGGTLFYSSYKGNSPSISQILASVSVLVTTTLGTIFFKEDLSVYKCIGIVLVLTAIITLNINNKEKFNKFNLLALLGGICYGLAYTIDKSFSLNFHPFNYLIYMSLSVALVSILVRPKLIFSETKKMAVKDFLPLTSSFIFFTIFDVSTFYAYKNGASVGVVDATNSIAIFLVIIAEVLILKDKSKLIRKLFAASLAFIGVYFFSLLK